jgi:hypothetical protein
MRTIGKGKIRKAALVIVLALLLTALAHTAMASYIYHMPVVVQSSLSPEVLMPGDTALLTITLKNGAAQYGTGEEVGGATLSTPVNRTELMGTDEIEVLNSDNNKVGMIGPGDEVVLYYNIKANESIPDATYFLDFSVDAGYDSVEICRQIPIKVDSTAVSISRAELPSNGKISLDVANPRQNTLNAVTIVPYGKGVEFSPEKYYIGTMRSDEIFTIEFDLSSTQPSQTKNLSFKSVFKNGDTWHESEAYTMTSLGITTAGNSGGAPANANGAGTAQAGMTTVAAAILLTGMIGGIVLWHKKKSKPKA